MVYYLSLSFSLELDGQSYMTQLRHFYASNQQKFYCISNKCQHQGGPLSKGILDEEKKVVTCPWHAWKYSIIDGKAPHKGGDNVDPYESKIIKDKLYVNYSH